MTLKKLILTTEDRLSLTIARSILAIVLFPHGAQKVFGWFGGFGFKGTMNLFTEVMGLPWIISLLVILIEFLAPFFLLFGLATRLVSALVFIVFTGILFTSHINFGFFMNWFGNQKGEGVEYFLLALALAAVLIIDGGGKYSMDVKK